MVALRLLSSNHVLLDQHDGPPAVLFLTPQQFAEFQDCLSAANLPRDLYYPATEQQTIVEPREAYGWPVMAEVHYSPMQLARRKAKGERPPELPSERERLERLLRACQHFLHALLQRRAELTEVGRPVDQEQLAEIEELAAHVNALLRSVGQRLLREETQNPPRDTA
jgi:hypothetical protein